MRNLFQHQRFEDKEFANIHSELQDVSSSAAKLSLLPQWHNGEGLPSKALGKNEDYYVNKTSGDILIKKNGEWS